MNNLIPEQQPQLNSACHVIMAKIKQVMAHHSPPILIALDGGSGSGKSTLALMLQGVLGAALVQSDDFFAAQIPEAEWDAYSIEQRARDGIDWRRLKTEALEPLLAGKSARWHPFDFEAGLRSDGTYGMCADYVECEPADIILLDGAYSARPELADLVTLSVLVDVPVAVRHVRLAAREEGGFLAAWHTRWDAPEAYYFSQIRPPASFDLVVTNG